MIGGTLAANPAVLALRGSMHALHSAACVRRAEFHTGFHHGRDESQVSREPVKPGYDQLGLVLAAGIERDTESFDGEP